VPLGFDYERRRKKLIPNKKERAVVNLVFDLYLEKKGLRAVARELNESGFKTKKGRCFLF